MRDFLDGFLFLLIIFCVILVPHTHTHTLGLMDLTHTRKLALFLLHNLEGKVVGGILLGFF